MKETMQTAPVSYEEDFDNASPSEVLKEIVRDNPDAPMGRLMAMYSNRARRNSYLFMKIVEADFSRRYKQITATKTKRTFTQSQIERAVQEVQERLPGAIGERPTIFGTPVKSSSSEELVASGTFQVGLGRRLPEGQTAEQAGISEPQLSRLMAATFLKLQKK